MLKKNSENRGQIRKSRKAIFVAAFVVIGLLAIYGFIRINGTLLISKELQIIKKNNDTM
jgi:hypothetical protein